MEHNDKHLSNKDKGGPTKFQDDQVAEGEELSSPSQEWHPNAPMNPNPSKAQPQPESTPSPKHAAPTPPVLESDDSLEHKWHAHDSKEVSDD